MITRMNKISLGYNLPENELFFYPKLGLPGAQVIAYFDNHKQTRHLSHNIQ